MTKSTNGNGWIKWGIGALFATCSALAGLGYDSLKEDITELQQNGVTVMQIQLDLVEIKGALNANVRERKVNDSLIIDALKKIERKMEQ